MNPLRMDVKREIDLHFYIAIMHYKFFLPFALYIHGYSFVLKFDTYAT